MQKPKLIIFDCDGVLVDSEVISAKILVQELAKINIAVSEQHVFERFVGRSLADVAESLQMPISSDIFDKFNMAYHTSLLDASSKEVW